MEAEEECPEVNLAKAFVEHLARHLWPPEVETCKHRKDYGSKENIVEVRNYEV